MVFLGMLSSLFDKRCSSHDRRRPIAMNTCIGAQENWVSNKYLENIHKETGLETMVSKKLPGKNICQKRAKEQSTGNRYGKSAEEGRSENSSKYSHTRAHDRKIKCYFLKGRPFPFSLPVMSLNQSSGRSLYPGSLNQPAPINIERELYATRLLKFLQHSLAHPA